MYVCIYTYIYIYIYIYILLSAYGAGCIQRVSKILQHNNVGQTFSGTNGPAEI